MVHESYFRSFFPSYRITMKHNDMILAGHELPPFHKCLAERHTLSKSRNIPARPSVEVEASMILLRTEDVRRPRTTLEQELVDESSELSSLLGTRERTVLVTANLTIPEAVQRTKGLPLLPRSTHAAISRSPAEPFHISVFHHVQWAGSDKTCKQVVIEGKAVDVVHVRVEGWAEPDILLYDLRSRLDIVALLLLPVCDAPAGRASST